jgi:hypothetical protein
LLAFHATVGCCVHHVYAQHDDERHSHGERAGRDLDTNCHHDHCDHGGYPLDSDDQDAPDHHECGGSRCVFLASAGSQHVQTQVATAWIYAPAVQPDQRHLLTQASRDSIVTFSTAATLSVRLHLLHELFLI